VTIKYVRKYDFMPMINHKIEGSGNPYKVESIEEFLARGGEIKKVPRGATMYDAKYFTSRQETINKKQNELRRAAKLEAEKAGIIQRKPGPVLEPLSPLYLKPNQRDTRTK